MPYQDPEVTDEDVAKRIEEIREQKAQYVEYRSPAAGGRRFRRGGAGKPRRRGRRAGEAGGNGAGNRRRGYVPGLHRKPARPVARRRKGVRGRLPGGLRVRPPGRQDREVPRHREGHPPQGTARSQRRVRPGTGRLPHRGRTARGHPQGAFSPSASTRRSRRPRTQIVEKLVDAHEFPGSRSCSSSGRSRTAWSRACAPWRPKAWIRAASSWTGRR